eukprot:scaffold215672_cov23-Tisochrysis_lutea.AAC.1
MRGVRGKVKVQVQHREVHTARCSMLMVFLAQGKTHVSMLRQSSQNLSQSTAIITSRLTIASRRCSRTEQKIT